MPDICLTVFTMPHFMVTGLLSALGFLGFIFQSGQWSLTAMMEVNPRSSKRHVGYSNTVMPNGVCKIQDGGEKLPVIPKEKENAHIIATAWNPHYGLHVVVTGRDSKIYHKHQIAGEGGGLGANWSEWKTLTPDLSKIPCSSAPHCAGYDNSPVIALQPQNQTLVVFVRQMSDLTVHEMHLTDPTDPDSWSAIRGPACLCNFPPCDGQNKCGVEAECDNKGVDCSQHPQSGREFWNVQAIFPTSELSLIAQGNKLHLYYRGFDGAYYVSDQLSAGDAAGKWSPPQRYDVIIE